MTRETLLDFFDDLAQSAEHFLVYDNGYRSWTYSYRELGAAAHAFADRLRDAGIGHTDKVIVWSENRPEWLAALWGCLLDGVILVPLDFRASPEFVGQIESVVEARLVLVGDETPAYDPRQAEVWRLADLPWPTPPPDPMRTRPPLERPIAKDDVAEIIFTSGATAAPKGVVITHRNVLANIVPVEGEILKYRKYGRPFFPIRFLNLLPLSHMFGQAMATFIPPMLPGVVVFMHGFSPTEIVRQIKTRRVSALVCVPKILEVLRDYVVRLAPETANTDGAKRHWILRWWRHRHVHRLLGLKFWTFIVGAAPLDPALEEFWSRLGFLVIQGYGLTETAPIVTLNHPFRSRKGSVGTPIAGVEVKIADDGEILVRGENVTSGYFGGTGTEDAFAGGWLHTGDVGELDESNRLVIKGRKKEMIVTPEGLNVFPEDVERVLEADPDVREAAVVGRARGSAERVHAVVVLREGGDADEVVRRANRVLEDHQRIRGVSSWPGRELPRTEGTRKLKRREVKRWMEQGGGDTAVGQASGEATIEAILSRFGEHGAIAPGTTLDELGLSSLERLEVMMAIEERYQTSLDETAFSGAQSVTDLRRLVEDAAATGAPTPEPVIFPTWNRRGVARVIRRFSLPFWILPLTRLFAWINVEGREHLAGLQGPVLFAANHQSHMDAPVILAALPPRWRYRTGIAMAKEFFKAHFFPAQYSRRDRLSNSLNYGLAALFFNAFPLPQREAGTRQTLRYIGELAAEGWSVLIFPEGRRTERGEIRPFQAGVGMISSRLELPVIPVRIDGLCEVLHHSWHMARPGRVTVTFGPALTLSGGDYGDLAQQVETAVAAL